MQELLRGARLHPPPPEVPQGRIVPIAQIPTSSWDKGPIFSLLLLFHSFSSFLLFAELDKEVERGPRPNKPAGSAGSLIRPSPTRCPQQSYQSPSPLPGPCNALAVWGGKRVWDTQSDKRGATQGTTAENCRTNAWGTYDMSLLHI